MSSQPPAGSHHQEPIEVSFQGTREEFERTWALLWPPGRRYALLLACLGLCAYLIVSQWGSSGFGTGVVVGLAGGTTFLVLDLLVKQLRAVRRTWRSQGEPRASMTVRFSPEHLEIRTSTVRREVTWAEVVEVVPDDLVVAFRLKTPVVSWVPRASLTSGQLAALTAWWEAGRAAAPVQLAGRSQARAVAAGLTGPVVTFLALGTFAYGVPRAWQHYGAGAACRLLDQDQITAAVGQRPDAGFLPAGTEGDGVGACTWYLPDGINYVNVRTQSSDAALIFQAQRHVDAAMGTIQRDIPGLNGWESLSATGDSANVLAGRTYLTVSVTTGATPAGSGAVVRLAREAARALG